MAMVAGMNRLAVIAIIAVITMKTEITALAVMISCRVQDGSSLNHKNASQQSILVQKLEKGYFNL